jgi:hypothetical protein
MAKEKELKSNQSTNWSRSPRLAAAEMLQVWNSAAQLIAHDVSANGAVSKWHTHIQRST